MERLEYNVAVLVLCLFHYCCFFSQCLLQLSCSFVVHYVLYNVSIVYLSCHKHVSYLLEPFRRVQL